MAEFPSAAQIDAPEAFTLHPLRLVNVVGIKPLTAHEGLSGVQYEREEGHFAYGDIDFDNYDDCIRTAEKTFDEGLDWVEGIKLDGVYVAIKCRPGAIGGGDREDYIRRVEKRVTMVEAGYLEEEIQTIAHGAGSTDLGDFDDILEAVAALVGANGQLTNPILHLNTSDAFKLATRLDWLIEVGVRVAVSNYYTVSEPFITGAINIWGTEIQTNTVDDVANNQTMAVAERQYVVTVEGPGIYATVVAP